MGEECCKIEVLANGFEVEIYDEKIAKKNSSGKGGYKDPWVSYAFKTRKEVADFVLKNLPEKPMADEYQDAFTAMSKESEEEED